MATSFIIPTLLFTLLLHISCSSILAASPTFNVQSYGAKSDGKTDSSKAFLKAWAAACATTSPATIYVPTGRYLMTNAYFYGDRCKNTAITIRIYGTLVAPSDYNVIGDTERWLKFEGVTGVSIYGGTIDGQGSRLWACKKNGKNCPKGTTSLTFYNSKNIRVNGLYSMNSQMFHILFDECQNVNVMNVKVAAPGDSPNTDGIHVHQSTGVTIMNSHVSTGDDCVSISPGVTNLWIENLSCGPGHGISIGSLGWEKNEAGVEDITVKKVTFTGTQNGVRVKTWARPSNGFVKNVLFQNLVMNDVENPIIIDQNYCPNHENCPNQQSGVKISDVTYQDIRGTSATKVAVKFDCSKTRPCSGITLDEVNLTYENKPAIASCANAQGTADGVVKPTSCL